MLGTCGLTKRALLIVVVLVFSLSVLMIGCGKGKEATYPNRPITISTGYNAGSVTDMGIRLLAPYLEKELGQPIIIVNKPGGGGWVAWSELAAAKPDGYSLTVVNVPNFHTGYLNPQTKKNFSVDNYTFLANHISDPSAISVRTDSKFKSVKEIVEYAKQNPGKLSITTTGPSSDDHLMALMLENYAKAKFKIVHMQGGNESVSNVLGGHIDLLCENVGGVMGPLKDGSIRMLGVATKERAVLVPDVPTLKEQGFDFVSVSARGIAAPKGLPADVKDKLAKALEKAINNPEHVAKAKNIGLSVQYMGPDEYTVFMKEQVDVIRKLMNW